MTDRVDSTHILEMGDGRARARLRVSGPLPPLAASNAVITVAHAAALAAGSSAVPPTGDGGASPLLQPVQLSVNLFRETRPGTLTAEAQTTFQSRNTLIVDVKVRDEHARLVATLAVTQLVPRAAAAGLEDTPARLAS
jgi:hypothetical protein